MTRHSTKRYKDNLGTPPKVTSVVDDIATASLRPYGPVTLFDVTRPAAPGFEPLDLGLDFAVPFCGRREYGIDRSDGDRRGEAYRVLYCNPPGDARGLHVRNAIDWAAAHHWYSRDTVVVALFNESALTYRKLVAAGQLAAPNTRHVTCVAGIFRKCVAWIDPDTGMPGKQPPHHGALLVATWDPYGARNVMHRHGMLSFLIDHALECS